MYTNNLCNYFIIYKKVKKSCASISRGKFYFIFKSLTIDRHNTMKKFQIRGLPHHVDCGEKE